MFALGGEKPVRRCHTCARWAYDGEIICSNCGTPLADLRPLSRRPAYVIAFVLLLVAVVTTLLLVIQHFIR